MSLAQLKALSMLRQVPSQRANKYALGGRRKRRRHGRGVLDVLKKGLAFAKQHKLISRGLSYVPHRHAKTAGKVAEVLGYGRRRHISRGGYDAAVRRSFAVRGGRLSYMHRAGLGRRRRHHGGDFLGIGNFFRKTLPRAAETVYHKALKPAFNFAKDQKLISKGLSLIPHPAGKAASVVTGALGLGRRRRVGRPRKHHGGASADKLRQFGSILGTGRAVGVRGMRGGCAIGDCSKYNNPFGMRTRPLKVLGHPLGMGRRRARMSLPRVPRNNRPIFSGGRKHGGSFVRSLPGFTGSGSMGGALKPVIKKNYSHNPMGSGSRGHYLGQYLQGAPGPSMGASLSAVKFG
jgi:hypothetical protein